MRIIILISLTLTYCAAFSQDIQIYRNWARTIGGSNYDELNSIVTVPDNDYLLAGQTFSTDGYVHSGNHENGDFWLLKINNQGTFLWEQTYGGTNEDKLNTVLPLSQNEYLLAGSTLSNDKDVESGNHGRWDYWIIKVNNNGKLVWEKTYGGSNDDLISTIKSGNANDILIGGTTNSNDGDIISNSKGENDFWIINTDDTGRIKWEKTYGGSENDVLTAISDYSSNGYLVGGSSNSTDGDIQSEVLGKKDFWIVKIDTQGNIIWEKRFGGSEDDNLTCIANDSNGGYLLAGYTFSNDKNIKSGNHGNSDFWVINIDSIGNIIWEKTYGGSSFEELNSISVYKTGDILLAGWSSSDDGDIHSGSIGQKDCWIVKISENGNLISEETYGGTSNEEINSIISISSNEFIAGGLTQSNDIDIVSDLYGNYDMWLITNLSLFGGGGGGTNISGTENGNSKYRMYPNPASTILNIDFNNIPTKYQIRIYNNTGQCYLNQYGNSTHEVLDISKLPKGFYYLNISNVDFNETKKIIVN